MFRLQPCSEIVKAVVLAALSYCLFFLKDHFSRIVGVFIMPLSLELGLRNVGLNRVSFQVKYFSVLENLLLTMVSYPRFRSKSVQI